MHGVEPRAGDSAVEQWFSRSPDEAGDGTRRGRREGAVSDVAPERLRARFADGMSHAAGGRPRRRPLLTTRSRRNSVPSTRPCKPYRDRASSRPTGTEAKRWPTPGASSNAAPGAPVSTTIARRRSYPWRWWARSTCPTPSTSWRAKARASSTSTATSTSTSAWASAVMCWDTRTRWWWRRCATPRRAGCSSASTPRTRTRSRAWSSMRAPARTRWCSATRARRPPCTRYAPPVPTAGGPGSRSSRGPTTVRTTGCSSRPTTTAPGTGRARSPRERACRRSPSTRSSCCPTVTRPPSTSSASMRENSRW